MMQSNNRADNPVSANVLFPFLCKCILVCIKTMTTTEGICILFSLATLLAQECLLDLVDWQKTNQYLPTVDSALDSQLKCCHKCKLVSRVGSFM